MSDGKPTKEELIAPQLAVQRYLDELLSEATLHVEEEAQAESDPNEELLIAEDSTDSLESVVVEDNEDPSPSDDTFSAFEDAVAVFQSEAAENEESIDEVGDSLESDETAIVTVEADTAVQATMAVPEVISTESVHIEEHQAEVVKEDEDIVPKRSKTDPLPWSKSRFECLLFRVGGLKMAVPLVELGGIQKADKEKLKQIFGQPDWFMGVATSHDSRIRTVDTARWVMPNHYQGELRDSFKFVIQLDRSDWGLACEEVAEAISLEPSEVKWRTDRSKRPWLAGTVIEHMCAILDVQGFIELLSDPKNGYKGHLI